MCVGCWETVATNPHAKLEDVLALVGSTGQPAKPRYKESVDLKAYDLGAFNSMVCFCCYSPAVLLCSLCNAATCLFLYFWSRFVLSSFYSVRA